MAKYMLIMRSSDEVASKFAEADFADLLDAMGRFNDELIHAGVLLAAEGLDDPNTGVVVDFTGDSPVVSDGPYGETKELFNGLYPRRRLAAGGRGVGEARAVHRGHQDRDPSGSVDRRVPAGQRVDSEGARLARADRSALSARC